MCVCVCTCVPVGQCVVRCVRLCVEFTSYNSPVCARKDNESHLPHGVQVKKCVVEHLGASCKLQAGFH